jgi:hypothetical protein
MSGELPKSVTMCPTGVEDVSVELSQRPRGHDIVSVPVNSRTRCLGGLACGGPEHKYPEGGFRQRIFGDVLVCPIADQRRLES